MKLGFWQRTQRKERFGEGGQEIEPAGSGQEVTHTISRRRWLGDLRRDFRYGLRMLRKDPVFTAAAVLALALGIGANTAVFTIVNTFLLNPLPVQDDSRLVSLGTVLTGNTQQRNGPQPLSYPNLKDLSDENKVFTSLAGYTSPLAVTLFNGVHSERIFAELVTGNYFETLGIEPARGRLFSPEEDSAPGAHPVAVLGYSAWQGRLGGVPDIVGLTIRIDGVRLTIIGVAAPGFKGVNAVFGPDIWLPAMMAQQLFPSQPDWVHDRTAAVFRGAGRLKRGVSSAQAEASLKTLASALQQEYPEADQGRSVALQPIAEAAFSGVSRQGLLFGSALLMAIVGLVLLIACFNVANLLLARASARRQEIAVRLALGAGRARLVRQLLTESIVLGLAGGVLGFVFGYAGCQLLWSFRPAEFAQNLVEPKLNVNVLIFTLVVSALTGVVFGLVPSLESSRAPVVEALKEGSRTAGPSRRRITFGNTLLVSQVALSLALLITAALFLRSVRREYTIDPGFQTDRLALFMMYPGQAGYNRSRTEEFYRQVRDRASTSPGVKWVSWASNLPLWGRATSGLVIEGQERRRKSEAIMAVVNTVDLDYFATMGIPLLSGRDFTENDREGAAPVAIVNETMASQYWPKQDPLGGRFQLPGEKFFRQVVGVARTANYQTLGEPPQPCVYIPLRQNFEDAMVLYVRTSGDASGMLSTVQREVRQMDPSLPLDDVRTGHKIIDQALWGANMGVGMLGVFGLLALGLACVGLYGIMAYSVNQRRSEIGLRMALGAGPASVSRLVLRQGMTLVITGVGLGLGASLVLGHLLSKFLYGVSASDPLSLVGASLALISVAALACYLPARRASHLDPLTALRQQG